MLDRVSICSALPITGCCLDLAMATPNQGMEMGRMALRVPGEGDPTALPIVSGKVCFTNSQYKSMDLNKPHTNSRASLCEGPREASFVILFPMYHVSYVLSAQSQYPRYQSQDLLNRFRGSWNWCFCGPGKVPGCLSVGMNKHQI